MAYRFDSIDDDVRFSMGALDTYTMGPVTAAALIKRNETGVWSGIITISDGGGTVVLNDLIELDNTDHFAFWNGRTGANDISGSTTGTLTDTANWYVVAVSWGGASTAPRYHWKQLGAGTWTHQSLSDSTGADSLAIATADRIIIGTDPSGADDLGADVVWVGINKSNDSDATIEGLDTTSWSTVKSYGFDWLVGFQASTSRSDETGGGGNEVSRAGTTLVSDPTGWSWGGTSITLTPVTVVHAAQPLTKAKQKTLGVVTSVQAAQALTRTKNVTLSPALSTNTAQALTRYKTKTISPVTESDAVQALSITHIHYRTITPAAETDTAQAITFTQSGTHFMTLTAVGETDAAIALSFVKPIRKTLTPASELDTVTNLSFSGGSSATVVARAPIIIGRF